MCNYCAQKRKWSQAWWCMPAREVGEAEASRVQGHPQLFELASQAWTTQDTIKYKIIKTGSTEDSLLLLLVTPCLESAHLTLRHFSFI